MSYETVAVLTYNAQNGELAILFDFRNGDQPRAIRNLHKSEEGLYFVQFSNLENQKELTATLNIYRDG